jgi:hypothetical protein
MDTEFTNGQTVAFIRVIGTKTRFQDTESIIGTMAEHIRGTGSTIICMDKESTSGLMVVNTKESM